MRDRLKGDKVMSHNVFDNVMLCLSTRTHTGVGLKTLTPGKCCLVQHVSNLHWQILCWKIQQTSSLIKFASVFLQHNMT